MPVYKVTIKGRKKPLLLRADSAAKAVGQIVETKSLTAEEMGDALAAGEKVWSPTEPFPADDDEPKLQTLDELDPPGKGDAES